MKFRGVCPKCGYNEIPHGAHLYNKLRCRCEICRKARADEMREYRKKKRRKVIGSYLDSNTKAGEE